MDSSFFVFQLHVDWSLSLEVGFFNCPVFLSWGIEHSLGTELLFVPVPKGRQDFVLPYPPPVNLH